MTSNSSLLQKADLAIADLQANGGILSPEEGTSFIVKLIQQPTLLRQARVVEMTSNTRKINKIGFGQRILRRGVSGVALTVTQRSKPTTEQISLTTKEQIAEVRIPYDVVEDAIENATAANNEPSNTGPGGIRQTIIDMIAERAALDIEELALLGDTAYTSGDPDDQAYLSQLNGWLKRAQTGGTVVNAAGAAISKDLFREGMKAMPDQYLRNILSLRHFVSVDQEINYRDTIADRATELGDTIINGRKPVMPYGVPLEPVSLMPNNKGLFTNPLNLIVGIQRQVSMEFDKDITSRVYIIVLTTRLDVQIEEDDAVVMYNNIGV